MRHPLVPALAVLLLLAAFAVGGAVLADADTGDTVATHATITGTVTDENGTAVSDAYVLAEPVDGDLLAEHTDGEREVAESLLKLGATDPDGVNVARTDGAGRFEASVPTGTYRVVAVTADGERVSRLNQVEAGGTVDLAVDRHAVQELTAGRSVDVPPGETATVEVALENTDDEAVRNLTVAVGALPDSWSLTDVATDGSWDPRTRSLHWDEVDPGETVPATLSVSVPEDASRGQYRVPLSATADGHFVESMTDGWVVVRPPDASPTPTVVGGPAGTVTASPPAATGSGPGEDQVPTPGFGLAVALAAVAAAGLRAVARSESR